MSVLIPVSVGELIDKITILEIKKQKISDPIKLQHIEKELTLLQNILQEKKFNFDNMLKIKLKEINEKLWDIENFKRDKEKQQQFDDSFIQAARNVYIFNDERARLKKEINFQTHSDIIEEKEHQTKKALFLSHLGMGDHILTNGLLRTFLPFFDVVYVVVKNIYLKNVSIMFSDTLKIKFIPVEENFDRLLLQPEYKKNFFEKCEKLGIQYNICSGIYNSGKIYDFPYCFYDELEVPRSFMYEKFYMNTPESARELYKSLENQKFIFTHLSSSNSVLENGIEKVQTLLSFDKNEILVIDPNKNHYLSTEEPFFSMAEQFLNKPIFDYMEIIKHAEKIAVTDSCFFCLSLFLSLKANDCIVFPRFNLWLFDEKTKFRVFS